MRVFTRTLRKRRARLPPPPKKKNKTTKNKQKKTKKKRLYMMLSHQNKCLEIPPKRPSLHFFLFFSFNAKTVLLFQLKKKLVIFSFRSLTRLISIYLIVLPLRVKINSVPTTVKLESTSIWSIVIHARRPTNRWI